MNHPNLVIKHQKTRTWYIGSMALLILFIGGVYVLGRYLSIADLSDTKDQLELTQQELLKTRKALALTKENLVMQTQSSQVDNLSNKELVNSVKDLQQNLNEQQEELKFYRRIMSPELEKDGIAVDTLKVSTTDNANVFHFRTTLIQAGKQLQFLKGNLILKINGELNGKPAEYDFRELGTFKNKHFQFQFKYFQNIQGFISLPSGFNPKKITLSAKTKGLRRNQKVEKQYSWQPEESQKYVR